MTNASWWVGAVALGLMAGGCARVGFEPPGTGGIDVVGGADGSGGGDVAGDDTGDRDGASPADGLGDVGDPPDGGCRVAAHCPPAADPCHVAACEAGACTLAKAPAGTTCDDGDPCTKPDVCIVGVCRGLPKECPAATGPCEEAACEAGQCVLTPVDCEDGNPCTADFCKPELGCEHKPACEDGDPCTNDLCEGLTGTCYFVPRDGDPTCSCFDASECQQPDPDQPCLKVECVNHACVTKPVIGLPCDDGDPCTTGDTCGELAGSGACLGTAMVCPETGDSCKPNQCVAGTCVAKPIDCNDGKACTKDLCDAAVGCLHEPLPCDDGVACTVDGCSEDQGGACVFDATGCACQSDEHCNPTPAGTLVDPCAEMQCVEFACVHVKGDGDSCDDGDPCTKGDVCASAQCVGVAKCEDGDLCTTDLCSADGSCVFAAVQCEDGDLCTDDACEGGACVFTPKSCDDNDPCTADACAGGDCLVTAITCGDDNPCTDDTCVADGGGAGHICNHEPTVCDAAVDCTLGVCSLTSGCVVVPDPDPACEPLPPTCSADGDCQSECFEVGTCIGGKCVFSQPVLCPAPAGTCQASECFEGLGCITLARDAGAVCMGGAAGQNAGTCNAAGDCVVPGP